MYQEETKLEFDCSAFKSRLGRFLAVYLWESCLTPQSLTFFNHQRENKT